MRLRSLLLLAVCVLAVAAAALPSNAAESTFSTRQTARSELPGPPLPIDAQLLGDISPGATEQTSINPSQITPLAASVALFKAFTPETGYELWRTDGTPAGTFMLADLWPGPVSGDPTTLTAAGGYGWFWAYAGPDTPRELWRSDGTAAGTARFAAAYAHTTLVYEQPLAALGNQVFFVAEGEDGAELWRSDGTAAGTAQVADLAPGPDGSYPRELTVLGDWLYFSTWNASGAQIWRTQGTAATTNPIATDLRFEAAVAGASVLFARGVSATDDCLLLRISVTSVQELSELCPRLLAVSEDWAAFVPEAGGGIYRAAATPASVELIKPMTWTYALAADPWLAHTVVWADASGVTRLDLASGLATPLLAASIEWLYAFAATPTELLLAYKPNSQPQQLWFFNGQEAHSTTTVTSLKTLYKLDQHVIGAHSANATYRHLVLLDTPLDAGQLITTDAYAVPRSSVTDDQASLSIIDDQRAFVTAGGRFVARPDGSIQSISVNTSGLCGVESPWMLPLNDQLMFSASYPFFVSDGTQAGTSRLGLDGIVRYKAGAKLYVSSYYSSAARGTWSTDGTAAGTHQISPNSATFWGQIDTTILLSAGNRLQALDPATDQLTTLADTPMQMGLALPDRHQFVFANALTSTTRLWVSDGTPAGTTVLATLPFTSSMYLLGTRAGGLDLALHGATSQVIEIWHTDGTSAGTQKLTTITDVPVLRYPTYNSTLDHQAANGGYFLNVGHMVWWFDSGLASAKVAYAAPDGSGVIMLGTVPAVRRVLLQAHSQTLLVSPASVQELDLPLPLISVRARDAEHMTFTLTDYSLHYSELWTTNGTVAGTQRLTDAVMTDNLQHLSADPAGLSFFFMGQDYLGEELWHTDGTPTGTQRVLDLNPGPKSTELYDPGLVVDAVLCLIDKQPEPASPGLAAQLDAARPTTSTASNQITFIANDGRTGREAWVTDGTATGTRRMTDLNPGPADGLNRIERWHDQTFLLLGDDGTTGYDLYTLELTGNRTLFAPLLRR